MALAVFLVPAYAIAVLSSRPPDEGCPSARQVSDALSQRIPGITAPASRPLPPGVMQLDLDSGPSAVDITLRDHQGELRLRRRLAPSPECSAMAETVALIVDRFLQELGYLGPPAALPFVPTRTGAEPAPAGLAPAPRLRAAAHLLGGLRIAADEDAMVEAGAGVSLHQGRWLGLLQASYVPQQRTVASGGVATLRRIPLGLGLFASHPVGPGVLEPGVVVGLELVMAGWTRQDGSSTHFRVTPSLQAALGYRLMLGSSWFARLEAAAVLNLVRYEFVVAEDVIFQDSRFHTRIQLGAGYVFR